MLCPLFHHQQFGSGSKNEVLMEPQISFVVASSKPANFTNVHNVDHL